MEVCSFGCGRPAIVQLKNGKHCCAPSWNSCPAKKKRTENHPWNLGRTLPSDYRAKVSAGVKQAWDTNPERFSSGPEHAKCVGKGTKGKNERPTTLYDVSSRTRMKIIRRMNLPCCVCGWNEGQTDLHHIRGRKVDDPDNHNNIACVCPNCHRLLHEQRLPISKVTCLQDQVGDSWLDAYYG